MSIYQELLRVQEHDAAIDRLAHRRRSLPERSELAGVDEAVFKVDGVLVEATDRHAEASRLQKGREDELAAVEARIGDLDRRMYSGTVTIPRELQAMQADMESLKRRRGELEESVLEAIIDTDSVRDEVTALESERATLDGRGSVLRAAIAEAEAEIDAETAVESAARAEAAAGLPEDLSRLYEQLRARLDGVGASPLANGRCGGCHLTLPSTELERIRHAPAEALLRCEQCSRILVR